MLTHASGTTNFEIHSYGNALFAKVSYFKINSTMDSLVQGPQPTNKASSNSRREQYLLTFFGCLSSQNKSQTIQSMDSIVPYGHMPTLEELHSYIVPAGTVPQEGTI